MALTDKEILKPGAAVADPAAEAARKEAEDVELGKPALAFIERSLGTNRKKATDDKAKPKDDAKPKDGAGDDELDELHKPAPKADKPKPAPKKVVPAPAQVIDEDKLGEAVGRSVVKAMEKRDKPADDKPKDDPELPAEVKTKLAMYERLEKHFPDKYKGVAKKFLANTAKFKEYADQWEKDNPGQEFDEEAEEHEDFRAPLEAETEYDEDDNVTALANDIADTKIAGVTKEFEDKLTPIRRREKITEKQQEIVSNRDKVGDRFWQRMGDDFATVLDDKGNLNPKALTELKEADPVAHAAAVNGAQFVENMATEVFLLDNNLTDFDGNNPAHKFLSEFSVTAEQSMAARPAEKQLDGDGRRFMPRHEYNQLSAKEQAKYWTFTYEDLGYLLAARIAKQTREHLQAEEEKFTTRAKSRGLLKDDQSLQRKSALPAAKPEDTETDDDEKPLSPSTAITPRVASSRGKPTAGSTEPLGAFASRAIRGR